MSARDGWRALRAGALAALITLASACGDTPAPAPATVQQTQGQTFACPDSFPSDLTTCPAASVGTAVQVNGGVHTGGGNSQLLMQSAATHFLLQPNSTLRYVEASGAGARFLLSAGRIFADHTPGSDTIVVQTGDSVVTALGTLFSVADEGASEVVSVLSGTVSVEVPPGSQQTRQVGAGQGMRIPDGAQAPPPPTAMTPQELRLWQQVVPSLARPPGNP